MAKLTNFIKMKAHKLKEHTKPIQTPNTEPSAKTTSNQEPWS